MINKIICFLKKHKILSILGISLLIINYSFLIILKLIPCNELKNFMNKPISTRIYDTNNILLQVLPVEDGLRREWNNYKNFPKELKKLIIKAEDKRFYFHHGVDFFAIFNAFRQNSHSKSYIRGASTIPMQIAKMIDTSTKQTYSKKIKDIFRAWHIEAKLSKKEILELYLNNIPFGSNCEGFSSASRTFFGKNINELTKEELAILCIIPRNPSLYNPIKNPENNAKMAYELLNSKNISTNELININVSLDYYDYPFFMPHYINYLMQNFTEEKGELSPWYINSKTPEIHLCANLEIYQYAQKLLQSQLLQSRNSRLNNGAILVLNNKDNSVLAWIGSDNYFSHETNGFIDGVLVQNQAGSTMKPFLYALALEQKDEYNSPLFYPSKVLSDIPKEYGQEHTYIPQNFNNHYNGPVRFRVCLSSSLNIPSVDILNEIGVQNYLTKLYELDFNSLRSQESQFDLGLSLGVGEVTLKELVPAFSVFSRDGYFLPLKHLKEQSNNKAKQVFSTDTSRIICSILSDESSRVLGFGYTQTFQTEYPSIFKTGTSNQFQDILALGSSKDFTVGVWMGNLSGKTVIGKTGSSLPAYIATQILNLLESRNNKTFEEKSFLAPENYTKQRVCTLSGLKATENCPSGIFDYIPNNLKLENCSWHKNVNNQIQTIYPQEYQQYLRLYDIPNLVDYNNTELEFISPKDNSVFYYSSINQFRQAISVELIGGEDDVAIVEYDGIFYKEIERPFYFTLPVERGNHTCKVKCGSQDKEFSFTVK